MLKSLEQAATLIGVAPPVLEAALPSVNEKEKCLTCTYSMSGELQGAQGSTVLSYVLQELFGVNRRESQDKDEPGLSTVSSRAQSTTKRARGLPHGFQSASCRRHGRAPYLWRM